MSCPSPTFGLYVHIPFCPQRCPYCAFTIVTGHTALYDRYVEAVCAEMRSWQSLAYKGPLQTVFFGGGTPSLLDPVHVQQILDTATATFGIAPEAEITLEANPTTADAQKFNALRASGCNRLSLGVQSFNDTDLKTLGRWHSAADAEDEADAIITSKSADKTAPIPVVQFDLVVFMGGVFGCGSAVVVPRRPRLTSAHRGRVEVQSKEGEGSRFIVELPLTGEPSN